MRKVNNVHTKYSVPAARAWAVIIMTKAAKKDSYTFERKLRKPTNNNKCINLNIAVSFECTKILS
jgi:hypothetical protein